MNVGSLTIDNNLPFALIAGPCAIETEEHALMMASSLKEITDRLEISFIYKSSYDKANRTSGDSYRGVSIEPGIAILQKVRKEIGCPVLTDFHTNEEASKYAGSVDVGQIPAFLSRQTDLIHAVAKNCSAINIKKAQFMAPEDIEHAVNKAKKFSENVLVTERGTSFGYHNLVVDYRGLSVMKQFAPVIFDGTHSVQKPSGAGGKSGGDRTLVPDLCRAAAAIGVAGFFLETHQDPDSAPSDGPNMVPLNQLEKLLIELKELDTIAKSRS